MDDFYIRLTFLFIGICIGWTLSMIHNTLVYTRKIKENTDICVQIMRHHEENK